MPLLNRGLSVGASSTRPWSSLRRDELFEMMQIRHRRRVVIAALRDIMPAMSRTMRQVARQHIGIVLPYSRIVPQIVEVSSGPSPEGAAGIFTRRSSGERCIYLYDVGTRNILNDTVLLTLAHELWHCAVSGRGRNEAPQGLLDGIEEGYVELLARLTLQHLTGRKTAYGPYEAHFAFACWLDASFGHKRLWQALTHWQQAFLLRQHIRRHFTTEQAVLLDWLLSKRLPGDRDDVVIAMLFECLAPCRKSDHADHATRSRYECLPNDYEGEDDLAGLSEADSILVQECAAIAGWRYIGDDTSARRLELTVRRRLRHVGLSPAQARRATTQATRDWLSVMIDVPEPLCQAS